jgi:hypothetical protein
VDDDIVVQEPVVEEGNVSCTACRLNEVSLICLKLLWLLLDDSMLLLQYLVGKVLLEVCLVVYEELEILVVLGLFTVHGVTSKVEKVVVEDRNSISTVQRVNQLGSVCLAFFFCLCCSWAAESILVFCLYAALQQVKIMILELQERNGVIAHGKYLNGESPCRALRVFGG